jgi:hypothetical protein
LDDFKNALPSLKSAAGSIRTLKRHKICTCVNGVLIIVTLIWTNIEGRLGKAEQRLKEETTGCYNFTNFYEEVMALQNPLLDHATYAGVVEVRESPRRGRGLFMTVPVKAGDLLVCEKAFALSYEDNENNLCPCPGCADGLPDSARYVARRKENALTSELIRKIIQKISKNPSLFEEVISLHSGAFESSESSRAPVTIDEKLVIDT